LGKGVVKLRGMCCGCHAGEVGAAVLPRLIIRAKNLIAAANRNRRP